MAGGLSRTSKIVAMALAGVIGLGILAEATAHILGSERLLYQADPEIEYLPQPNQAVVVRNVDMRTNAWGMRSDPVEAVRPADVFRAMVIGDSVVFGFTNIGQADLATSRLSQMKTEDGRRLEVLNVSASSWGPGNMLAWLDKFGTLETDAIVLVLSTHDLEDDRMFAPPERDAFPQSSPVLKTVDWAWRRLTPDPAASAPVDPRTEGDAHASLPVLLQRVAEAPTGGCLIIHPTTEELKSPSATPEEQRLETTALAVGLTVLYGRDFVDAAKGYVDDIHLSASGQEDLARAIAACPNLPRTGDSVR